MSSSTSHDDYNPIVASGHGAKAWHKHHGSRVWLWTQPGKSFQIQDGPERVGRRWHAPLHILSGYSPPGASFLHFLCCYAPEAAALEETLQLDEDLRQHQQKINICHETLPRQAAIP